MSADTSTGTGTRKGGWDAFKPVWAVIVSLLALLSFGYSSCDFISARQTRVSVYTYESFPFLIANGGAVTTDSGAVRIGIVNNSSHGVNVVGGQVRIDGFRAGELGGFVRSSGIPEAEQITASRANGFDLKQKELPLAIAAGESFSGYVQMEITSKAWSDIVKPLIRRFPVRALPGPSVINKEISKRFQLELDLSPGGTRVVDVKIAQQPRSP